MKSKIIIIDESGTLPDANDKVVIIAAVVGGSRRDFLDIVNKTRRRIVYNKKEKAGREIKFYRSGEKTKQFFFRELAKKEIEIFALIIGKEGQKIKDSPGNFAILAYLLLRECLFFYKNDIITEVIFDRHFHREKDRNDFNKALAKLLAISLKIKHLDSQQNAELSLADMVAGCLLQKYTRGCDSFYKIIKNRILIEKVLYWKDARRELLAQTKKPHEPAQAPIR